MLVKLKSKELFTNWPSNTIQIRIKAPTPKTNLRKLAKVLHRTRNQFIYRVNFCTLQNYVYLLFQLTEYSQTQINVSNTITEECTVTISASMAMVVNIEGEVNPSILVVSISKIFSALLEIIVKKIITINNINVDQVSMAVISKFSVIFPTYSIP